MRGLFTAGVLDVLMERGVKFDGAIGVSAGACFGCNYKSGQIGRVIRYNKRFARDSRYCSWKSLITTGDLFGAEFCYRTLPLELDPFDGKAYEVNPMEFYAVVTDCETGKAVHKRLDKTDEEALDWIRASASMPLVSRPVAIGGREYLDGGLSDAIPLKFFESIGYERNVVITTRPRGYRKFPKNRWRLFKPLLRKYPAIYNALRTRYIWYNETLDYIEKQAAEGNAIIVAPEKALEIGRVCHDAVIMQKVYDLGREAGKNIDFGIWH